MGPCQPLRMPSNFILGIACGPCSASVSAQGRAHLMPLLNQADEGSTHGDDVIIRVGDMIRMRLGKGSSALGLSAAGLNALYCIAKRRTGELVACAYSTGATNHEGLASVSTDVC